MTTAISSGQRARARRRFGWHHIVLWVILVLAILLLAARLYLPIWLKHYVNEQLNNIPGYAGSVDDIGVQLYRGAYTIHGLELHQMKSGIPVPFLSIVTTDLSIQWGALFHGRIVSDVHLLRPTLNFAVSAAGGKTQTGRGVDWMVPIKKLMPIDINVVAINQGKVAYRDFSANPPVNIYITDLHGQLNNLRNIVDKNQPLPSTVAIQGESIGKGRLGVNGRMNVLTTYTDMDVDMKLENADLPAFNSFSEACCGVDFRKGEIDIYSELVVKNGNISGYVKPLVHHLAVEHVPHNGNPLEMVWANVASVLFEIFKNQPKDQFATKIPLSGRIDKIETSTWPALGAILHNAFIKAFTKGTDGDVSYHPPKNPEMKAPVKPVVN